MRILIVGSGSPIPSFIQRRLHALIERGVNVVVSLEYGQKHQLHKSIEIVRYGNVFKMNANDILYYLSKLLSSPHIFFRLWKLNTVPGWSARLKTTIKYFPLAVVPNVTLIHIQWITLITGVSWLKALYRVPIVASVRGSQVTIYPYTRPGYRDIVKQSIQLVDACHLVSHDLKIPCKALGVTSERLFVNYNGINLNKFKPSDTQFASPVLLLVSVGALMWRKAYTFQLLILKRVLEAGIKTKLTIVGSGKDLEGLTYTAIALNVHDYVVFAGQLSEDGVVDLLQQSSVYLSTSVAEGLPNSLVEAAACGLPIVTFACEGASEIVEDGATGFIVPVGEVEQAAKMICKLSDQDVRFEFGKRAREKMEQQFDERFWVDEMMREYTRIASEYNKK